MTKTKDRTTYILSRREFVKHSASLGLLAAGGSSLATLLASCSSADEAVALTHFIWAGGGQGDIPREVVPAYIENHPNVSIELFEGSNSETYPKMIAAREADPDKPLIHFGFFNIGITVQGHQTDMWASLNPDKIPNMNDIPDGFHRPENKGIGWGMVGLGLLYNTDEVDDPPTSWLDLLDPRFKGKVALWDADFKRSLVPIAHALGGDASNVEEAWELLSKAAKDGQFLAFGSSNDDMKNALVQEGAITVMSNSFSRKWGEAGVPVGYAVPKEGQIAFPLFFQIVNGCTDRQIEVASDIINTYLDAETLSRYCNITKAIPAHPGAKISEELKAHPAYTAEAVQNAMFIDWDTMATKDAEWKDRWQREVLAEME